MATQSNEIIARMSRDPRLDAFNSKNKHHFMDKFLWEILHQAEIDVVKSTRCKIKEMQLTLAKGARAINLPDDFLEIDDLRYRLSSDSAEVEGYIVEVVDKSDLL